MSDPDATSNGVMPLPRTTLRVLSVALLMLLAPCHLSAQTERDFVSALADRNYKALRETEDWQFLRDPSFRNDLWDGVKYIPLRINHGDWYMTVGGEIRQGWEQIGNDNWGQRSFTSGYLLQRYMLSFDVHYSKHVRSFIQLKSALESSRIGGPRPIDAKRLDFNAAWLEVGTAAERNGVLFRVGRQELSYGSGRLVSVREGPNARQSFDGFKIRSKFGAWSVDGFAVRPDLDRPGFFDNAPDHRSTFWGIYVTRSLSKRVLIDLYYLGLDKKQATFDRGSGREVRQTVGARVSRTRAGQRGWDFDYEGIRQFGTFGSASIRAWALSSETGYSLSSAVLKPRFSIRADIASGDDPKNKRLGTFNPIFPIGSYFSVLASTGPGPVNFMDVHPRVQTQLPRGVSVTADWIVQWRQSLRDGVYSVPGLLIRGAHESNARFVGNRPGIDVRWQVDPHLYFQADYGIFYAGRFLKETMPGKNLNYWALWAGFKF